MMRQRSAGIADTEDLPLAMVHEYLRPRGWLICDLRLRSPTPPTEQTGHRPADGSASGVLGGGDATNTAVNALRRTQRRGRRLRHRPRCIWHTVLDIWYTQTTATCNAQSEHAPRRIATTIAARRRCVALPPFYGIELIATRARRSVRDRPVGCARKRSSASSTRRRPPPNPTAKRPPRLRPGGGAAPSARGCRNRRAPPGGGAPEAGRRPDY